MTLVGGTILAGYRVDSLLGRGEMGEVYLATHEGLGRKVALKLLAPELAADEGFRQRFIAESRLAASLDHPHIVPIHEAGEADGRLFLAMRYVEGADLGAILAREGRLDPVRAIRLLRGVADALDAAHERGLVHRNVKPGNILVARTGRGDEHAYLADFGLTRQFGPDSGFAGTEQLRGSVQYVAPEQVEGRASDARVDVYALACVLYGALAGQPPHPHETGSATLGAQVQTPRARLSDILPDLAPLDEIVARGMANDPTERYATAGELLDAAAQARAPAQESVAGLTRGFLFADLRGYTNYVERHGDDAAAELLARYRRLVREVVARQEGAEVRTEGDSFYVLFPSASRAVSAGLDIVASAARAAAADPAHRIRVGVGVHAGETAETTEGPVGSAVNVAARICAQADAGQVLVSDTVRGLTRTRRVATFESVGRRRLKGIAEPLLLYRAVEAGSAPDPAVGPGSGRSTWRSRFGRSRGRLIGVVVAAAGIVTVASIGLMTALARPAGGGPEASEPAGGGSAIASLGSAPAASDPAAAVLVKGLDSPGTYQSEADGIRVNLEVPAGWRATDVQQHSLRLALADRVGSQVAFVVGQPSRIFSVPCGDKNDIVEPFLENIIPAVQDNLDLEPEEGVGAGPHGGRYVVRRFVEGNAAVQTDATVIGGFNCYADGVKRVVLFTTADRTYIDVVRLERVRLLVINFGGNDVVAIVARAPSASEFDILTTKLEVLLRGLRFARA